MPTIRKKMKFSHLSPILLILLVACNGGIKSGNDLSKVELEYIREIGLLTNNEKILRFTSQSVNSTNGGFISDKRLAYYWIDERNETNEINSAIYSEIDTLIFKDLSDAWTYSSFIKVVTQDSLEFKVYVNDDREKANEFFETAMSQWKK
ncbi:hypothetical protein SAMN05444278_1313 [Psychroflexus salarius]|uniref:Lipoprotein n=1 Tax=Psychroflexus salarius TaxID=1155689 RepID=A0A1M4YGS0_9FLAO|nr:hypothetical protein SAMN05444278_1313 [Psychroflexus salarius]